MYTEVILDDAFKGFKMIDGGNFRNISRINVLIGKNNSGKSRFVRTLFSNQKLNFKTEKSDALHEVYTKFKAAVRKLKLYWQYGNHSHLITNLERVSFPNNENSKEHWEEIIRMFDRLHEQLNLDQSEVKSEFKNYFHKEEIEFKKHINGKMEEVYRSIYIPILRGLRPVQSSGNKFDTKEDVYFKRTKKDYFPGDLEERLIISGLGLYEETKRLLLGRISDRRKVQAFEKFISETFFEEKEFSIVPHVEDDVIYVRIGSKEEDEKPIHHLGDGIQAIIVLTYPLFFHQGENCAIYFEEPETHLHPGLQRLFIETLRRPEFSSFQYFLTTHSNHFLDLTADYNDIAVYSFKKDESDVTNETFLIENVEDGEGSVLQEIGVRASSVFLSNCTIWVEGITDRLYLRKFLAVYQEKLNTKVFKEDYHYSFVEYGGNNITHWSFLDSEDDKHSNINVERLCKKIFLITDKDGAGIKKDGTEDGSPTGSKKYERHKLLEAKLGENYYCLPCREIENTLTPQTIKGVIVQKEGNSELDFSRFDKADYKNERLGKFISDKVDGLKRKYASSSGTVHDKLNFCKIAVDNIEVIDDLSEEAKILCEKLYKFISEANSL